MKQKTRIGNLIAIGALAALLVPSAGFAQGILFVQGGKVGIGVATPSTLLNVVEPTGAATGAQFLFDIKAAAGDPKTRYIGQGGTWSLSPQGVHFVINKQGASFPGNELRLLENGNLEISGNLTQGSSRTIKENIQPVVASDLLSKVLALPISEWSYIASAGERHVGPISEDFSELFGLGGNPQKIAPGDVAGVALASVQALNSKLEEKNSRIAELEARLMALEARVQSGR